MHTSGHRERLRARFNDAPEKLADYEIVEMLLGYVILRRDTKPIAKELLDRFHSLHGIIAAKPNEYADIPGISKGVSNFFSLLQEFLARYLESPVQKREELCTPEAVARMARQRLGKLQHEEIWIAYVDKRNRLISWEKATRGTVDTALIFPRDIIERALLVKATGFIMVHNHPGGDPTPSGADIELTQHLQHAACQLQIRFVDHVVVTDTKCHSLMSDGLL